MLSEESNLLGPGIGSIQLLDYMGSDTATVNAAKASYDAQVAEVGPREERLIAYLGAEQHTTPFRHIMFSLRFEAPEFLARQLYKHTIGSMYSFNQWPWNEASQRYKAVAERWYLPEQYYTQGSHNKQKGGEPLPPETNSQAAEILERSSQNAYESYRRLLALGVSREQARLVLPLNVLTTWVWTASLQAVVHMVALRTGSGAQQEAQIYAHALQRLCRHLAPRSWDACMQSHPSNLVPRPINPDANRPVEL